MTRHRINKQDLVKLDREARQLKERVLTFQKAAQAVAALLDPIIPPNEVEAMETPRANLLGTAENLVNQDLNDILRQIEELGGHLRSVRQSKDATPPYRDLASHSSR
jgi:hypothetical protein